MPALYLIEMVALPTLGAALAFLDSQAGLLISWAVVGSMAGFVVLGVWSIGLAYTPVLLVQGIAATLALRGQAHRALASLAVAALAATAQVAIMFALIRILSPDASF
ncbi:MAG: hypothetical protein NTY23_04835 [Chloroflexi bacterium]|nr:hypothetical protein [Chloroflexota bacterium]